ncbi:MAG: hypothetical protein NUV53_00910 [Patescibacteria group bacterium]|nr:hypothetical protein [Patescibacteria group bacterium]
MNLEFIIRIIAIFILYVVVGMLAIGVTLGIVIFMALGGLWLAEKSGMSLPYIAESSFIPNLTMTIALILYISALVAGVIEVKKRKKYVL